MFRRALMKSLPTRSGGHPDFPFLGYYKNKRIISPYDNNLWVYDGMNPEYLVDFQCPQFTFGHIVSRNLFFAFAIPLAICFILGTIVHRNFKRPFIPSVQDSDKDPIRKFMKKIKNENVFASYKHPVGHFHTYTDEGWDQSYSDYLTNKYKL